MKTKILIVFLCFFSLNVMGQGTIERKKKQTTEVVTPKPKPKPAPTPKPTPEAIGYDVTFTCNVPSATLYIDGNANGNASGTRFLKTGSHSIKLTCDGYDDYSTDITVSRKKTSFTLNMTRQSIPEKITNPTGSPVVIANGNEDYTPPINIIESKIIFSNELEVLYKKGLECYYQKDYDEAVKWFRKAAEQGHAEAQADLGYCYDKGQGVTQDYGEAVKWYRKAAEQGQARAQCNLGECYYYGQGVTQDYGEAVKWYCKAADQGHAMAQFNLGYCYRNGKGVTKDKNEAIKWYKKAAKQGNKYAQQNLKKLGITEW